MIKNSKALRENCDLIDVFFVVLKNNNNICRDGAPGALPEVLNERALSVINRVSKKLTGRDFAGTSGLVRSCDCSVFWRCD